MRSFVGERGSSSGIQQFTCELAVPIGGETRIHWFNCQSIADLAREGVRSEWFLNEIGARFQLTLADGRIVSVSGHIEYFDVFPHAEKSLGEIAAAH